MGIGNAALSCPHIFLSKRGGEEIEGRMKRGGIGGAHSFLLPLSSYFFLYLVGGYTKRGKERKDRKGRGRRGGEI